MRSMTSWSTSRLVRVGGAARQHLDRAADASQRILDLVRDHRGHLAQMGQRRLLAQPRLQGDAAGQVVQDARELPLAGDRDLAHRQVQRERRPVLAPSLHLTPDTDDLGPSSGQVSRQVGVVLLAIRGRHQHVDVVAEDLVRGIAEEAFGRRVEGLDASMGVDDQDGVDGRIDDRPPTRFAGAELALEPCPARQVVQHARELALAADVHLANRQVDGEERAIAAAAGHLATDANDLGVAGVEVALEIAIVLFVMWRGHQQADIAAHDLGLRVAEQLFGTAVERLDAAARVDHDDAVGGRVQDGVEPLGAGTGGGRRHPLTLLGHLQPVHQPRDDHSRASEHS